MADAKKVARKITGKQRGSAALFRWKQIPFLALALSYFSL
jgi:hypothetical protein